MDLPENRFVLWILFVSGYNVDLFYLGHGPYFEADSIVVRTL